MLGFKGGEVIIFLIWFSIIHIDISRSQILNAAIFKNHGLYMYLNSKMLFLIDSWTYEGIRYEVIGQ